MAGYQSQFQQVLTDDIYHDPTNLMHQYGSASTPSFMGAGGGVTFGNSLPTFDGSGMSMLPMMSSSVVSPSGMADPANLYNNTPSPSHSIDPYTQFGVPNPLLTQALMTSQAMTSQAMLSQNMLSHDMPSQSMPFQPYNIVTSPATMTTFSPKKRGSRAGSRKGSSRGGSTTTKGGSHGSIFDSVSSPTPLFADTGIRSGGVASPFHSQSQMAFPINSNIGFAHTPTYSQFLCEEPTDQASMYPSSTIIQNGHPTPSSSFDLIERLSSLSLTSMPDINDIPFGSIGNSCSGPSTPISYMQPNISSCYHPTTTTTAATTAALATPNFRNLNQSPENTIREVLQCRPRRKHTDKDGANYVCLICRKHKYFNRLSNYKTHMRLHDKTVTRIKPFACLGAGCSQSFGKKPDCVRHMRSCFKLDKCHLCPFVKCGSAFSRSDTCRRHYERSCPIMKRIMGEHHLSLEQIVRYSPEFDATILTANAKRESSLEITPEMYRAAGYGEINAPVVAGGLGGLIAKSGSRANRSNSNGSVYSVAASNRSNWLRNGSATMGNTFNNSNSIIGLSTTGFSTSGRSAATGRSTTSRRSSAKSFKSFMGSNIMPNPMGSIGSIRGMNDMGSMSMPSNVGNYGLGSPMGMMVGGY